MRPMKRRKQRRVSNPVTNASRLRNANTARQQRERAQLQRSGWTPQEIASSLSDEEADELTACESVIETGIKVWYQVGEALLHIRDKRLYRADYTTFESYCRERWNMRRDYANKLISASDVIANLDTNVSILPANESQARALASLEADDQRILWPLILDATDNKPTGKASQEIVKAFDAAPEYLRTAVRQGDIGVNQITPLSLALQGADSAVLACVEKWHVTDAATIDILKRLHTRGSETFMEVFDSGYVQPGDEEEAVSITASSLAVQRALDLKAKIHKQMAADDKKQALITRAEDVVSADDDHGILTGNASQLFDVLQDNSVDLFLTDPPYHLATQETYGLLARLAARKLKPGGLCIAYSGQMFLPDVMHLMGEHLCYWWMFAVQHTGAALAIWNRSIQTKWRSVLVYAKPLDDGSLPLALEHVVDIVEGGGRKKEWHAWGQDANELTYWIERMTHVDMLLCDPFVGGGAVPVAAKLTGRRWIGTELDTQQAQLARLRVMEVQA